MILERDDLSFRNVLLVLGACALIGAAVWSFPKVSARYQRWKHARSLSQIQEFAGKGDPANMLLAVRNAMKVDPGNPLAWRMAADLLEQAGDAGAVKMRQEVVALEPESIESRLALARTALRFLDVVTAREALDAVPRSNRDSPDYIKLSASLAMAGGRPREAEAQLAELLRSRPGDLTLRLERAIIASRYAAPAEAAAARGELQVLADRPETSAAALRELATAALHAKEVSTALAYVERLTAMPEPALPNLILRANILLTSGRATVESALPPLKARAVRTPGESAQLAGWLLATGKAAEAYAWLQTLPPASQAHDAVRSMMTDCLIARRDWSQAGALIAQGAWGPVSSEAVQLAMSVRVLRDHEREKLSRGVWDEAVRLGAGELNGLRVLYRLALVWGWGPEGNAVLFAIVGRYPHQHWAYKTLVERAMREKDTAGLRAVYQVWRAAEPADQAIEANHVFLSLLLDPSAVPSPAKAAAARLYTANAGDPFVATSYAFSLWQLGRGPEALEVMEKLSPEARRQPARALYHALFLASAERRTEAGAALARVDRSALFPEESELFNKLTRAVQPTSMPAAR